MGDLPTMHRYHAFGGSFATDLEFPELSPARTSDDPDWTLRRVDALPEAGPWRRCGSSPVEEGVESVLHRGAEGWLRLTYDDTGPFQIAPDGCTTLWCPPRGVDEARARRDVLGRVFAAVFHQQGLLTFHGSAVAVGGEGVCFLAPKYHGKSTTAAALVDAGATLLADDLVVVGDGAGAGPSLVPTLSTLNLWPDAAERVGRGGREAGGAGAGSKVQVDYGVEAARGVGVPLRAVYLLAPRDDAEGRPERVRLESTPAALSLLGQLKIGELLGPPAVLDLLPRAASLAATVGVYRLEVPRGLDRLPELVARMDAWHRGEGAS